MPVGAAAYVGHAHARPRRSSRRRRRRAGADRRASTPISPARIRLSDVALGELFAADAIEASVALDSLLSGQLGADEIRVAGPRVAIEIDRDGDSDLARLVRRLAHGGSRRVPARTARVRRIVVELRAR